MKASIAGIGMYSFIIVSLLNLLGIDVPQTEVDNALIALFTFVTFLIWVYGQLRRSDLVAGLLRKK